MIAKYYPSLYGEYGWLFMCCPTRTYAELKATDPRACTAKQTEAEEALVYCNTLDEWFKEHRHNDYTYEGPTHFTIEYEEVKS